MSHLHVPDKSGRFHEVYRQEKTQSCGLACAAMLINRMTGVTLDEKTLRKESRDIDKSYSKHKGTSLAEIIPLLERRGIIAKGSDGLTWEMARQFARNRTPVICQVAWTETQTHMVLIDGQTSAGEVIICDPDAGLGGAHGTPADNHLYLANEESYKFYRTRDDHPGGMFIGSYVRAYALKLAVAPNRKGFGYEMPGGIVSRKDF